MRFSDVNLQAVFRLEVFVTLVTLEIDEEQMADYLVKRVFTILQKGLASMLLNRVPGLPLIGGRWTTVDNIITPDQ